MRGGSKSIPLKNIKTIAGKPLFAWSIEEALASGCFDAVIVSTESTQIAQQVQSFFGEAVIIDTRPDELAQDQTSTEDVMLEFASRTDFETMTLIQVTNPFVTALDFRQAFETFKSTNNDGLLTVSPFTRFLWDDQASPINYDPHNRPRRQEMKPQYIENGAFYITPKTTLLEYQNRLGKNNTIHIMAEHASFEIDEPDDWIIVEKMLTKKHTIPSLKNIKAIAVDIDGTMTDGGMYYGPEGEALKKFNTRDAHGLKSLEKIGLEVIVMTAEDSPSVDARIQKLGFKHYFKGIQNKKQAMKDVLESLGIEWNQLAFVGDDMGDLEVIESSGVGFCPSSAIDKVQSHASYILKNKGGDGAVREACDLILQALS